MYPQPFKKIVEQQPKQDYISLKNIKHLHAKVQTQTTNDGIEGMQYLFDKHNMQRIENCTQVKL